MKKIIIFLLAILLTGCTGNSYEVASVEKKDSIVVNNYEINKEFSKLEVKVYDLQKQKWKLVETTTYTNDDVKGQLGIEFVEKSAIKLYMGDYNKDENPFIYQYDTHMEEYDQSAIAARSTLYGKEGKETPFLAYWAFKKDTKYKVKQNEDALNKDFLKNKNKADGGFLITFTFYK